MNRRKQFFSIIRVQLKVRFGLSAIKASIGADKGSSLRQIGLVALVLFSVLYLAGLWAFLCYGIMAPAVSVGMGSLILAMLFFSSALIVLLFGIVNILGLIFSSRDIEFLASMPIPQWMVLGSKLIILYITELAVMVLFSGPAVVMYGIFTGAGILYYIKSIVVLLLLPLVPICLASLICLVLYRFISLFRRRDLFTSLLSILSIVAIMFVQMQFQRLMVQSQMTTEGVIALLNDMEGLISTLTGFFPPAAWSVFFVTGSAPQSLIYLVYIIITCGAALAVALGLGNALFYKGALAMLENRRSGKSKNVRVKGSSSAMLSVFRKEWKTLVRSTVYLMNALSGIIVFPIVLIIMPMTMGSMEDSGLNLSELVGAVEPRIFILILTGAMLVTCSINMGASTSVSREGPALAFLRSLPISPEDLIWGKFWFGQSICLLGIVVLSVCVAFIMPGIIPDILLAAVLAFVVSLATTALSLIPDIIRPKLEWNSEAEAMKQNLNGVIGMGIAFVHILALVGLVFLIDLLPVGDTLFFALFIAGAAVIDIVSLYIMNRTASRRLLMPQ